MSFSNQVIKPLREDKPHIVKLEGLWRVSPYHWKKLWMTGRSVYWNQAHRYTNNQNEFIRAEQEAAKERQREFKRKQNHCPYCLGTLDVTHRDGVRVVKCHDKICPCHERWLEPEDFQEYYK